MPEKSTRVTMTEYAFRSKSGEDMIRKKFRDAAHAELFAEGWNAACKVAQSRAAKQIILHTAVPVAGGMPIFFAGV